MRDALDPFTHNPAIDSASVMRYRDLTETSATSTAKRGKCTPVSTGQ